MSSEFTKSSIFSIDFKMRYRIIALLVEQFLINTNTKIHKGCKNRYVFFCARSTCFENKMLADSMRGTGKWVMHCGNTGTRICRPRLYLVWLLIPTAADKAIT